MRMIKWTWVLCLAVMMGCATTPEISAPAATPVVQDACAEVMEQTDEVFKAYPRPKDMIVEFKIEHCHLPGPEYPNYAVVIFSFTAVREEFNGKTLGYIKFDKTDGSWKVLSVKGIYSVDNTPEDQPDDSATVPDVKKL